MTQRSPVFNAARVHTSAPPKPLGVIEKIQKRKICCYLNVLTGSSQLQPVVSSFHKTNVWLIRDTH